jgi:polysaccharide pyruvyl transferase WcaK-like protein
VTNIIVNNTVLRNNGDAAIVTALHGALRDEGYEVCVGTSTRSFAESRYPALQLCGEVLGYSLGFARRNRLARDLAALALLLFSSSYRRANVLIGAPGGYLNSFYGFDWKLRIYAWAKRLGKRTMIYAQSVGPLSDKDMRVLRELSEHIDLIVVRDDYSFKAALGCGIHASRLMQTPDAIFLRSFTSSPRSQSSRVVGISVRDWKHEGRSQGAYVDMICALVREVLNRGHRVEFVSTCQGVAGYTDDSVLATEIVTQRFAAEQAAGEVTVDRDFHCVADLEEKIRSYHCVVGTRLHMCLLSLVNGVPAFNIGYEVKGKESYRYLGFADFSIDYNEGVEAALESFVSFLGGKERMRAELPTVVASFNSKARDGLRSAMGKVTDAQTSRRQGT